MIHYNQNDKILCSGRVAINLTLRTGTNIPAWTRKIERVTCKDCKRKLK